MTTLTIETGFEFFIIGSSRIQYNVLSFIAENQPEIQVDITVCDKFTLGYNLTTNSAVADKPHDALVKVTKRGTISYVRYGFLLVSYSNFVRKIFDFKNAVTRLRIREGH